jgi:hyperosmotically inducible periplasmic protein
MSKLIVMKQLAVALLLTVSVTACAAMSGRETTAEYVDDATITTKVKAAILDEPSLKSRQVSVETMQNAVQLSGFVDSAKTKSTAGEIARGVPGVRSVKNDLIVR